MTSPWSQFPFSQQLVGCTQAFDDVPHAIPFQVSVTKWSATLAEDSTDLQRSMSVILFCYSHIDCIQTNSHSVRYTYLDQWESQGHRMTKFWVILGQSGSPVLIYTECEQVGLIDHVHPEFMSLELLFRFLYFLESVHLDLVKIKVSWASQYSSLLSLMLT